MLTGDFGGHNDWTVFNGAEVFTLSRESFYDLASWCSPGETLVVEDAHLGRARTKKSLAQVYTASELLAFYRQASNLGITLRLFPHSQTPKARALAGFDEKNDAVDAQAIHAYLLQSPSVLQSLKLPPRSFEPERWREAGWAFKDDTNMILNVARRFKYKTEGDQITSFIFDNLDRLASIVPDDAKEIFGLLHRKKDGSFYALDSQQGPKLSKLYSGIVALERNWRAAPASRYGTLPRYWLAYAHANRHHSLPSSWRHRPLQYHVAWLQELCSEQNGHAQS